jgi:hypothetical protein
MEWAPSGWQDSSSMFDLSALVHTILLHLFYCIEYTPVLLLMYTHE